MVRCPGAALDPVNTTQTFRGFPFILHASPKTNLWVKPRSSDSPDETEPTNISNQPYLFLSPYLLCCVGTASLTFSFIPTEQHDQAGIILQYTSDKDKWVKAGLELLDGVTKRVVVTTPGGGRGSDRSIASLAEDSAVDSTGRIRATVDFEREQNGTMSSLLIKIDGELLREVTWVFAAGDERVQLGFYAARPSAETEENLEVTIEKWGFETS